VPCYLENVLTRVAALLVLLAALLQAAPVAPGAVSVRSAAAVRIQDARKQQRPLRRQPRRVCLQLAVVREAVATPRTFAGYTTPHFQRPPPTLS
jgi:hypothetical protein